MSSHNLEDLRSGARQCVAKTGVIRYAGSRSALHCVVRDISGSGARLQVQAVHRLPDVFELSIDADGFAAGCVVVWRGDSELGVTFVDRAEAPANNPPPVAELNDPGTGRDIETPCRCEGGNGPARSILVAEDDPDDRLLIREAFEEGGCEYEIEFAHDGDELVRKLIGDQNSEARAGTALILLDLNMPKMDGRQALRVLKSDPQTCDIPVVIFTTSIADDDIKWAKELGVSSYVIKPSSFDGLLQLVETLQQHLDQAVRLSA